MGLDETCTFHTDYFAEQVGQALRNIISILNAADAVAQNILQIGLVYNQEKEYLASLKSLGQKYREEVGWHYPVMTVVEVKALMADRAKVETRPLK